jgi:hypothetical protein
VLHEQEASLPKLRQFQMHHLRLCCEAVCFDALLQLHEALCMQECGTPHLREHEDRRCSSMITVHGGKKVLSRRIVYYLPSSTSKLCTCRLGDRFKACLLDKT